MQRRQKALDIRPVLDDNIGMPAIRTRQFLTSINPADAGAFASTWYVNSAGGSDSNDGLSLRTAFLTLQQASSVTAPGDTVNMLGTFGGGTSGIAPLIITTSGTAGHPITYQSYYNGSNGPRAVLNGTRAPGVIQGSYPLSYITINDLEIVGWMPSLNWVGASANSGASGAAWESSLYNGGATFLAGGTKGQTLHHIILMNNLVHDFPGPGLGWAFCDYVSIIGNTIYNTSNYSPWGTSAISLYELHNIDSDGGTRNVVANNIIYNNANYVPSHFAVVFTTTSDGTNNADNVTLVVAAAAMANYTQAVIDVTQGCIPPGTTVIYYGAGYVGLSKPQTCSIPNGSVIQFGYITDGEGIIVDNNTNTQSDNIAYVGRTLVSNNVVYNNGSACIEAAPDTNNVDVTYNTCYQNQTSFQDMSSASSEFSSLGTNGSNIYNNIFAALRTTPVGWDQSASTTTYSNNLYWGGDGSHPLPGHHKIKANPDFDYPSADPALANFRLRPDSPAIGAASKRFSRPGVALEKSRPAGAADNIGAY